MRKACEHVSPYASCKLADVEGPVHDIMPYAVLEGGAAVWMRALHLCEELRTFETPCALCAGGAAV